MPAELTTPDDGAVIPDAAELIVSSLGTILSPTGWIRTVWGRVAGWEPMTDWVKPVSGDWNAVAQASRGYDEMARYFDEYATELNSANNTVQANWDGNAADAASTYFSAIVSPLQEFSAALTAAANEYSAVSVGMHRIAAEVASLIGIVTDKLIFLAIEAAATAATSWTLIGPLIGGAAMAATIASTINSVKAVGTALSVGQHIIDTSVGVIAGFLGALHGIDSLALPNGGAAYDHPGATR
mgnify:FL=1